MLKWIFKKQTPWTVEPLFVSLGTSPFSPAVATSSLSLYLPFICLVPTSSAILPKLPPKKTFTCTIITTKREYNSSLLKHKGTTKKSYISVSFPVHRRSPLRVFWSQLHLLFCLKTLLVSLWSSKTSIHIQSPLDRFQ